MKQPDPDQLYRKIEYRLIPLLFAAYFLNHLDRVNLGFAHLQMRSDLGLSDSAYALAAGIYFIGYVACEVPATALMQRLGGKRVLAVLVASWGLASAATLAVQTAGQLLLARVLLGALEAGFFPCALYYLSQWLPPSRRGRALSLFMMAVVLAGIVSGPLSGWMLATFHNLHGLRGWQWMFLLQGMPGVPLACLLWRLPDGPATAKWLSPDERHFLTFQAEAIEPAPWHSAVFAALKDARMRWFTAAAFLVKCGSFALVFWVPTMIQESGIANLKVVGLLSSVPNLFVLVAMAAVGAKSDQKTERRWHFAGAALFGAAALSSLTLRPLDTAMLQTSIGIASAGLAAAMPVLWASVTAAAPARTTAITIAFVGSVSNLAGFTGPVILGLARQAHLAWLGFALLGALAAIGAIILPALVPEAACWGSDAEGGMRTPSRSSANSQGF